VKVWHCGALALAVGCLAAGLTYWLVAAPLATGGVSSGQDRPAPAPLCVVSQPVERSFVREVPWTGAVQSQASVRLTARVAGRVEAIQAEDQAPVQAGAAVVRLGGPQVELRRTQMQAVAGSLRSRLALADEVVKRLEKDLTDRLATTNQLAAAQGAQLELQAMLEEAELALASFEDRLLIVASVSGVLTNRQVSVGQVVEAGQVVAEVIDPSRLRIVASLFPPAGLELQGMQATVQLGSGQTIAGIVEEVLPSRSETGAMQLWIEGPEIDRRLRPGQTAGGAVAVQISQHALAVPVSAVVYDAQEQPRVFVEVDGAFQQRAVTLGQTQQGWVEVLSGLQQNEPVVTQGAYELYYRQLGWQLAVED